MKHPRAVRSTATVLAALVVLAAPSAALAKRHKDKTRKARPSATKMNFKLDTHNFAVGDELSGLVYLSGRSGRSWEPVVGAELRVLVDGEEVAVLSTEEGGWAVVSHVVEADDEVVKVIFEGDAEHKKAKRAQGFEVGQPGGDDEGSSEEELDDGEDELDEGGEPAGA